MLLAHSLNSIEHTIIGSKLSFQQEKIKEKKQYEEILIERQAKYREFEGLYQNTNSLAAEDYSPSSDIVDSSIWSILGFSNISLLLWTICVILFALLLIYFSFIRDLLHFSSLNYLIVFIIPICHEQYHFSCYAICLPLFTSFIMFILLELGKWIYHCQHNIKPRY